MHSFDPPYAHNDVKPGNVLITHRKGQPPLAILMDFGSARPARKEIHSRSEALRLQAWPLSIYSAIAFFFQHFLYSDQLLATSSLQHVHVFVFLDVCFLLYRLYRAMLHHILWTFTYMCSNIYSRIISTKCWSWYVR